MVKITESPRDAMQGLTHHIDTEDKIKYVKSLQKCGFDIIDVGSFVSPAAVPQMADTPEVLKGLDKTLDESQISVLVGNSKYAEKLSFYDCVKYINYPLSISEKFQLKNLKANHAQSKIEVDKILNIALKANKNAIISVSAAFGNPYKDEWDIEILIKWIEYLRSLGLRFIPLADTTASGTSHTVAHVFSIIIEQFKDIEFNFHLHSDSSTVDEKIEAAYLAGCRNFDTVYGNMGGCPMTGHDLTANLDTVAFLKWLDDRHEPHKINREAFYDAILVGQNIFSKFKVSI